MRFFRRLLRPNLPPPGRPDFPPGVPPPPMGPFNLPPPLPPRSLLEQAQHLLMNGDPEGAAVIFDRLSHEAYAQDRIWVGVQMTTRAVQAWLAARNPEAARQHVLQVAQQMAALGRGEQAARWMQMVLMLFDEDYPQIGQQLQQELRSLLGSPATQAPAAVPAPSQHSLPAQCPSCGAPVRPDDVKWIGADRVECAYCGNIILAK